MWMVSDPRRAPCWSSCQVEMVSTVKGGNPALTKRDLVYTVVIPMLVAAQDLVGLHGNGPIAGNTVGLIGVKENLIAVRFYQKTGMAKICKGHNNPSYKF